MNAAYVDHGTDPFHVLGNCIPFTPGMTVADMVEAAEANYGVHKGRAWCQVSDTDDERNAGLLAAMQQICKLEISDDVLEGIVQEFSIPKLIEAPNTNMLYRDSDTTVVSPNSVSDGYGVIDLTYMGEILQQFVDEGLAKPEACFVLTDHEGRASKEILVARLTDDASIPGDKSEVVNFLLMYNPQGHGSIKMVLLRYRLWCLNMLPGAIGHADISMPHRRNVQDRFSVAMGKFEAIIGELEAHNILLGVLNETDCDIHKTVAVLLGIDGKDEEDITTQKKTKRDTIVDHCDQHSIGTFGKTLGDVYQGWTHYMTHSEVGRGGKQWSTRFASILDGQRGRECKRAFRKLLTLAGIVDPHAYVTAYRANKGQ